MLSEQFRFLCHMFEVSLEFVLVRQEESHQMKIFVRILSQHEIRIGRLYANTFS